MDQCLLNQISLRSHFTQRVSVPNLGFLELRSRSDRHSCSSDSFGVVLSFHPVYSQAVNRALACFKLEPSLRMLASEVFGSDVELRPAWKLTATPLVNVVRKH